ncbi:shikimate dehydrogenase [Halomonas halocynthiae]|uniref:shikimate dehydrogenase n=1 Tax=Halomonas halocynthiae TaxID=176290 RepID=UPI000428B7E6|nr:shikimate dehydrogenase [Halomonas halocynthiae]
MTDRYAVFGHPVSHSKSPLIHAAFAEQTEQDLSYQAIDAPHDGFAEAWKTFITQGGRGANVTVPFKEQAHLLCDQLSERAQRAGAVNTLWLATDGTTHGDTTDGLGLVADLQRNNVRLTGARILLLGAGGAVRGVLEPLLNEQPAALFVANRTADKACALAADFSDLGAVSGGGFASVTGQFDVIINGTSASLGGKLPPLCDGLFADGSVAYDMMYGAEPTVFMRWADAQGAKTLDGLGMLVEQAAASFSIWRGKQPDVTPVLATLRQQLS